MTRKKVFVFIAILLITILMGLPLNAAWSRDAVISRVVGNAVQDMCGNSSGNAAIMIRTGDNRTLVRRYNPTTRSWGSETAIASFSHLTDSINMDGKGNIYALVSSIDDPSFDRGLYAIRYNASTRRWGTLSLLDDYLDCEPIKTKISVSTNDTAAALWTVFNIGSSPELNGAVYDVPRGTWSTTDLPETPIEEPLSYLMTASVDDIAVDCRGNAVAVYDILYHSSGAFVKKYINGTGWETEAVSIIGLDDCGTSMDCGIGHERPQISMNDTRALVTWVEWDYLDRELPKVMAAQYEMNMRGEMMELGRNELDFADTGDDRNIFGIPYSAINLRGDSVVVWTKKGCIFTKKHSAARGWSLNKAISDDYVGRFESVFIKEALINSRGDIMVVWEGLADSDTFDIDRYDPRSRRVECIFTTYYNASRNFWSASVPFYKGYLLDYDVCVIGDEFFLAWTDNSCNQIKVRNWIP